MRIIKTTLCSLLLGATVYATSVFASEVTNSPADKQTFDSIIKPFLTKHCTECHGDKKKPKGDTQLHNISFDLASAKDLERWQAVYKQIQIGEMPPEDEPQPDAKTKQQVLSWINTEMVKSGNSNTYYELIQKPHYGNYVNHEKLFSGEIKDEPFSPARLWRRSPYHFDNAKNTFFGISNNPRAKVGEVDKLKQPFQKGDGEGITDYAALLYADSATFDTLYRNAEFTVDRTLLMGFIEYDYKSQGKTMEDWKADYEKVLEEQKNVIEEMKKMGKNPRYVNGMHAELNRKYRLDTPQVYKDIILGDGKPTKAQMEAAITNHYIRTVQQDITPEELSKYTNFMADEIKKSGPYFGLRNAMIAILVSPQFVYRSELGLGKPVGDGRTMLSPVETAYAISYALTDEKPDEKLIAAVKSGKLTTKDDVRREVLRILEDDSIDKPRILRFFHEFFGYHRAPDVFKDEERFFKGYLFGGNANRYVHDADVLVLHILKNDKDVIKELLTTDKYFVSHNGNNAEVKAEVEAHKKFYAYFKDKNWQNFNSKAKKKEEPSKEDLKFAQSLHPDFKSMKGDSIYSKMKQLEYFEKKNITPSLYEQKRTTEAKMIGVQAYNLPGKDWDYVVEQPFVVAKGKRAGILTHPAWLIAHSLNAHNDPVRRGKWIREYLLAGTIPDVPITVDATIPEDPHKTLRERYGVSEKPECWKCHTSMNPLGYAFEMYDDFGRWRDKENMEGLPKEGKNFQTKPLNTTGSLTGSGDSKLDGDVKDAIDLVHRLGQSRKVQQSIIRYAFRYWHGRNEMLSDSKTLIQAEKDYMANGGSFKAMLVSLLTSDSFLYRKKL